MRMSSGSRHDGQAHGYRRTLIAACALTAALLVGMTACTGPSPDQQASPTPSERSAQAEGIARVVEEAMTTLDLKAVIVQVQIGDEIIITEAFGESMTGVPATTDMHFRNGAVAFSYVSNLLLQYVDDGTVSLDDTIEEWLPELPEADTVTLRMLTNQTTGYPDFETDPGWTAAYNANPFHEFTFDERIEYAFNRPLQFEPGTNWSYAHTNFMILGEILSQIGGEPLDELLKEKVLDPMGLTETAGYNSSYIPEPVLHAFSSERRVALGIDPSVEFYEESSFWNPVWGTPMGAAQTTTITDMTKTAIAIGTGALLSDESFHEMTDSQLIGFGEKLPVCEPSCFTQIDAYNYGLGVVRSGEWMLQNPELSGYSAAEAYLPSKKVAISVANTFEPGAFDADGIYDNSSDRLFRLIGAYVVPDDAPPQLPPKK
ncbi:MAG: beta-lactamase family protein [Actinomycetota bacterium]|nr:beta-lactamase family protein [Actinomycetota bacterium]